MSVEDLSCEKSIMGGHHGTTTFELHRKFSAVGNRTIVLSLDAPDSSATFRNKNRDAHPVWTEKSIIETDGASVKPNELSQCANRTPLF